MEVIYCVEGAREGTPGSQGVNLELRPLIRQLGEVRREVTTVMEDRVVTTKGVGVTMIMEIEREEAEEDEEREAEGLASRREIILMINAAQMTAGV